MELTGHIENGVVVFDGGTPPPEGTRVTVVPEEKRIYPPLPVIYGGEPGSVNLTNEMIHEILNEYEDRRMMEMFNVPT